jgi:hypothetical protein
VAAAQRVLAYREGVESYALAAVLQFTALLLIAVAGCGLELDLAGGVVG